MDIPTIVHHSLLLLTDSIAYTRVSACVTTGNSWTFISEYTHTHTLLLQLIQYIPASHTYSG